MEKCDTKDSTHVMVEQNRLYKSYLSMIEKKWTDLDSEVYSIESYKSSLGVYFSVIYGFAEEGSINRISVHCDEGASSVEVSKFVQIVFRSEIVDKIKRVFMAILHIEPESLLCPVLAKFDEVTDYGFNRGTYSLYYSPNILNCLKTLELPTGYRFGILQKSHVTFVAKTWARDLGIPEGTGFDVENYVELNMKRPHVAVFYKTEDLPVGWMLIYADASIGQLHIVKSHRRKGIGRIIVRKLTQTVIDAHGVGPHVMINDQNDASYQLFSSAGWYRAAKQCRIVLSKK